MQPVTLFWEKNKKLCQLKNLIVEKTEKVKTE